MDPIFTIRWIFAFKKEKRRESELSIGFGSGKDNSIYYLTLPCYTYCCICKFFTYYALLQMHCNWSFEFMSIGKHFEILQGFLFALLLHAFHWDLRWLLLLLLFKTWWVNRGPPQSTNFALLGHSFFGVRRVEYF